MAFPTSSVLDDFNRADHEDLGSNWTDLIAGWNISSNAARGNQVAGQDTKAGYNVATYGPDCEAYATMPALMTSNDSSMALELRLTTLVAGTHDGYHLDIAKGGTAGIYRLDNGGYTLLGSTFSVTVTAGYKYGFEAVGSTLTAYYYNGSSWASITSRDDSTYGSAGYLGIHSWPNENNGTGRFDDFGGGTISGASISVSISTSASVSQSPSISQSPSVSQSLSISPSISGSASVSPSISGSVSVSPSISFSASISGSASVSPSVSQSASISRSPSVSPSISGSVSVSPSVSRSVSPSVSPSISGSASVSPSISGSASVSPSISGSASISRSPSVSQSVSQSGSVSPSISGSASISLSPSVSPSISGSASASPSISQSASVSPSISGSASESPSISLSASVSPSISGSASESPSISGSASGSPSVSGSASESPSISISASVSYSISGSASESPSISESASASPSEPPLISGSVVWGHDTGVIETNIRDFSGNWTGTGGISGVGDAETMCIDPGEYMESEVVITGTVLVTLLQNTYDITGDTIKLRYRHGADEAACLAAAWQDYTVPFTSLGYVQIRVEYP